MLEKHIKKTKANERRKDARAIEALTVVRCSSKVLFESNFLSRDISEDGICLLAPYKMEIGEVVKLGIYFPEQKNPVIAWGKIMRRNESNSADFPFMLGIQFTQIDKSDYEQICSHLKYFFLKT